MIKLIGWDMDGVLIDSLNCMEASWNDICEELDLAVPFSEYKQHIGKPFEVIMLEIGIERNIPQIKELYIERTNYYRHMIKPFPGSLQIFQKLKNNKYISGIITSKPRVRACQIIDQYRIDSDFLVTPDDCSRGKPLPDPLLLMNEQYSIRPDHSLFIGDMTSDYKAARSAGWHFIHAAWGYEPNLICGKTHFRCSSASEIASIELFDIK